MILVNEADDDTNVKIVLDVLSSYGDEYEGRFKGKITKFSSYTLLEVIDEVYKFIKENRLDVDSLQIFTYDK